MLAQGGADMVGFRVHAAKSQASIFAEKFLKKWPEECGSETAPHTVRRV